MTPASGTPTSSPALETVDVSGGEQRHDIRLPGGVLNGVVENRANGDPVPGVRVLLERTDDAMPKLAVLKATGGRVAEGYAGPDGHFKFRYLPEGTYTVVAGGRNVVGMGAEGWAVTRVPDVRVTGGGPGFTVHVKVSPAGAVAGRVSDLKGQPLAGVSVWFRDPDGRWQSTFSEVTTDSAGEYTANSLTPGSWSLAFRDATHGLRLVPEVLVRTGETTPVDVTLDPGVPLNLAIGDHDPWSLMVLLEGPDGPIPTDLVSMDQLMGEDGALMQLGVFGPGPYHLRVMSGGQSILDTTVVLVAGSGAHLVPLAP
jgi:hypothetical protein